MRGAGAYLLDPGAAAGLARGGPGGAPARVELHGTARQWRCGRRPWLGEEARECFRLLRGTGAPVSAEFYAMGGRGDLSAHLELLDGFRPGAQGRAREGGGPAAGAAAGPWGGGARQGRQGGARARPP